eukprot:755127-Rhodomonas_salina.2
MMLHAHGTELAYGRAETGEASQVTCHEEQRYQRYPPTVCSYAMFYCTYAMPYVPMLCSYAMFYCSDAIPDSMPYAMNL